jgi:MoaE-MoaD fusion protein
MTARVEILYFGGLRPLVDGARREELVLDGPCDVQRVMDHLCREHPSLARVRKHIRTALNERFADDDEPIADGDRLALIPPVAGGADSHVRLSAEPLDVDEVINAVGGASQGGIAVFLGAVRDHNDGKQVIRLEYETYDEMVLSQLERIVRACETSAASVRLSVVHRVGTLEVGELAVAIAASAPHRAEAFAACRACIELLKRDVPIWKREISPDGDEWIGLGA